MAKYYKVSMEDGSKVDLTLNLGAIAELSKRKKGLADRYFQLYNKMQRREEMNELDMAEVIYIGYVCAHLEEDVPDLSAFLYKLTDNREELGRVFQELFGLQEKKQGFPKPSGKQQRKRNKV